MWRLMASVSPQKLKMWNEICYVLLVMIALWFYKYILLGNWRYMLWIQDEIHYCSNFIRKQTNSYFVHIIVVVLWNELLSLSLSPLPQ